MFQFKVNYFLFIFVSSSISFVFIGPSKALRRKMAVSDVAFMFLAEVEEKEFC